MAQSVFRNRHQSVPTSFNPVIYLNNGISFSVMGGHNYQSIPKHDNASYYTHVEVAYVEGGGIPEIEPYRISVDGTNDIFANVPIHVLYNLIDTIGILPK